MRRSRAGLILLLAPMVCGAADTHLRFGRITLAEGRVEVEQAPATGERIPAERNLPVGQGFWVETGGGSRTEIELDEGSYARLAAGSLAELSDLTRLSTGQRISVISVERGTLYVTSEPARLDAVLVVAPGLQITFLEGSRVRLEASDETSSVAVLEGRVRLSSPAAELDLREGQTVQINPKATDRFQLFREVTARDADPWNEQRDRDAAERARGTRLPLFSVALAELDATGKWIENADLGKVWQPRVTEGWAPFRQGRWRWIEGLGYTWIGEEPWAWLPYHFGRWANLPTVGWVWTPGATKDAAELAFQAGDVYWLKGSAFVGWGPVGPGETRPAAITPANTTFAPYDALAGAPRVIETGLVSVPPDLLKTAQLVTALPAPPALPVLAARKRLTRVGTTRILPVAADLAFDPNHAAAAAQIQITGAEPPAPEPVPLPAPSPGATYYNAPVPVAPVVAPAPGPPPPPAYYPVYVPEVIVIDRNRPRDGGGAGHGPRPSEPPHRAAPSPGTHLNPPTPHQPPPAAPPPAPKPGASAPPPAPKPEAAPKESEGPEHRTRPRSPESGDSQSRRR